MQIKKDTELSTLATMGAHVRTVLLHYQLDFCCGGKTTLAAACEAGNVSVDEVMHELAKISDSAPENWTLEPAPKIVEHIVTRFHGPHRQAFTGLIAAAEKVERVHAKNEACPVGLAVHLSQLRDALQEHMNKEERVLFPAIKSGARGPQLSGPVTQMMREHVEHGDDLRRTRELTHDFTIPTDACGTWRGLYEALEQFEVELMTHVHLENNVLFPKVLNENQ